MTNRLLILEDEPLIAWGIADELEELGWSIAGVVGDTKEALDVVRAEAIDAAVLDFNLRRGTSEVVARELFARSIPFLFVSGAIPEHVPSFGIPVTILTKPIDFARLDAALRLGLGGGGTVRPSISPHASER